MPWTVVTGGAKRLGAQLCKTLAQKGHDIIVHYRNSEKEATDTVNLCRKHGVKAEMIQGDFTTKEATERFLEHLLVRFDNIANLINNVSTYSLTPMTELSIEEWKEQCQVNVDAPLACILALLPQLSANHGNVVNIGVSGLNAGKAGVSGYFETKMMLLRQTKALAKQLAQKQVRVNMVSPGQLTISSDHLDPKSVPMRRLGELSEVARVVVFLLDNESSYITGQNIEVAGGLGL